MLSPVLLSVCAPATIWTPLGDELTTQWSCNLHEALLEGLLRAKRDAQDDKDHGVVTLMVVISNSWASTGNTNRTKIAGDVWKLNEEGSVKIFSLGSPWVNSITSRPGSATGSLILNSRPSTFSASWNSRKSKM